MIIKQIRTKDIVIGALEQNLRMKETIQKKTDKMSYLELNWQGRTIKNKQAQLLETNIAEIAS